MKGRTQSRCLSMSALQATLARFEAEAAKMAALKKDIAASRAGKPPPAKKARKAGSGERPPAALSEERSASPLFCGCRDLHTAHAPVFLQLLGSTKHSGKPASPANQAKCGSRLRWALRIRFAQSVLVFISSFGALMLT